MKKITLSIFMPLLAALFLLVSTPARSCEVSISEMNWPSSQVITEVAKFFMENGYGCKVTKVPSSTVPVVTSLAENNTPDIATELWVNSAPAYAKLEKQGKAKTAAQVLSDGGVEGWWIPKYLADKHPQLKTIEGILKNPELVGGKFHNCPLGWGCRIANDNYKVAYEFEKHGLEVFDHGSGETLAGSIASAYSDKKPWFGYYWAPTAILGKYPMVRVDVGPYVKKNHDCAQLEDCKNRGKSSFPAAPVVTAITTSFAKENPAIAKLMSKVSFSNTVMGELLAWKQDNKATAEETAVHFLTNYKSVWTSWLNSKAKAKLAKAF